MASHDNYPEFCSGCLDICGRGEIFKSSVLISAKEKRDLKCRLCRLLFSMSAFAQRLQIDPLRSYEIKILPLIGGIPIVGLDFTQYFDYHGFFALAKKLELFLSPASFSIVEKYVDRTKGEKQGVFTMRLIRSISMQSRLPLLGLKNAQIAFNHMAGSNAKLWQAKSTDVLNPVRQWISDCTQHHQLCATRLNDSAEMLERSTTSYPVRLIELESSTAPPSLRLVEFTQDFPSYMTLSHRWGSPQPFKTTKANFSAHCRSIPFIHLPKTFTDAFSAAQALAVKYIWIDSICIIQDCQDDWRRQSEQMGSIYQMSLCTLAAIDANTDGDKDKGLFLDWDELPFSVQLENEFKIHYNNAIPDPNNPTKMVYKLNQTAIDAEVQSASAWETSHLTLKPSLTPFEMSVELSEWNSRAWIFQERMLSTRLLYFTREQVFWECAEHITSEQTTPKRTEPRVIGQGSSFEEAVEGTERLHRALRSLHDFHGKASSCADDARRGASFYDLWDEYQIFRVWWILVERYSASKLTYDTDKWYAIAGLCSILQNHFQSTIHAGIWKNAIGAGILWHVPDEVLRAYKGYHSPSWSWLGINGAVKFAYKDESYTGYVQKVKPLYENASFSTTDTRTGNIPGSLYEALSLSCPSRKATISSQRFSDFVFNESTGGHEHDPPAWKFFHDISHGKSQLELSKEYRSQNLPSRTQLLIGDNGRAIGWVVMDFDEQTTSEVLCVAIALRQLNNHRTAEQHIVECIVIIKDLTEPHSYRRIGRGRIVEYGWLATCTTRAFQII